MGDTVSVRVPDGSQREYLITGVLEDMPGLLKADVCGMVLSKAGFRAIADENAEGGTTFRIQFKDGVSVQNAVREIKEAYGIGDEQTAENTVLLGLLAGQIIIWAACLLLKSVSSDCFSEIPLFQFSWVGLTAGAAVVFLDQGMPALAPWAADVSAVMTLFRPCRICFWKAVPFRTKDFQTPRHKVLIIRGPSSSMAF